MSPEAVTTERIYALLKADVIGGRYAPRSELVTTALAKGYGVSITPVRDSAQRLIGERLLEPIHAGGFAIPDVTEDGLGDLYFWHGQLVRNALHSRRQPVAIDEDEFDHYLHAGTPAGLAKATALIFQAFARRSGNDELVRAVVSAGDRLHSVRLREATQIPDVFDELRAVRDMTAGGSGSDLIHAIWAYHRRRLRRVRLLVQAAGGSTISR